MRSPLLPGLKTSIVTACLSFFLSANPLFAEERFEFANAPLDQWNLEREAPLFQRSHPSVTLQIQEANEGPAGGPAHVLEMKGDHRGFRNVKDFAPPLREGVISFDLRIKSGGLLVTAFESSQNKETLSRGVRLLFHATGGVDSCFGIPGGDEPKRRHMTFKRGVWYRTEIDIRLSGQGGGTYSVRITDLASGEPLPLTDSVDLPIETQVLSIGGWDFHLTRANSEVELDNLVFSPSNAEATP